MRSLCLLVLLFPLLAAAQGACNNLPEDAALQCLQKRQVLLDKARVAKTEQLKGCLRARLEESPERQAAALKEFEAGEKFWRKHAESNCAIHEAAFLGGSARQDQSMRCEIREIELRSARVAELGQTFACFDAKGQRRQTAP